MIFTKRVQRALTSAVLAGLMLAGALCITAQQAAQQSAPQDNLIAGVPLPEASEVALPLPEDRGAAALEQALKRLKTTASVMMIVAHPDDEDGALLTYLSRGMGARCTLLTLTRGEGGQNAMGEESYDALGIIRTNELLKASEYYGAKQLWGTEADFGFSKTQEESFAKWGHDRVLYDAVLAVRRERPQVIVSTFVGGVSDGHGHHQVSGEIAQEVFKAANDPAVFPEQLKGGLQPWQPLAVYSMVPFAPIKDDKMFDYATGKWAPARFKNYVTGEWIEGAPSTDVTIQVGSLVTVLGRSPVQIAREGWGQQKSQNGGANPTLSGPASTSYHLWAVAPAARTRPADYIPLGKPREIPKIDTDIFHNRFVSIDTWIGGLPQLAKAPAPRWLVLGLAEIGGNLRDLLAERKGQEEIETAHKLAAIYRQTLDIRARVQDAPEAELDARSKASLFFEIDAKINEFQSALKELLGLDLIAFRTNSSNAQVGGPFRGSSADETPRSVTPGEDFHVRIHTAHPWNGDRLKLSRVWLESRSGNTWKTEKLPGEIDSSEPVTDSIFRVQVSENAEPTQPYFTRPNIEQPYYDLTHPEYRLRSFVPYPLSAWAEFSFDGLPIRVGQVVQTMQRVSGVGGVYEPLVVTPLIGVRMEPEARILPLDGSALPVRVTVHTQAAAEGTVALELPAGWTAQPSEAQFHRDSAGDTEPILFSVMPDGATTGAYNIEAVARSGGHEYKTGWRSVGYTGLRPYNQYKPAELKTRKVDVKLAPELRIGYVMGTGDLVPEAIEGLGGTAHLLTATELTSGDLSAWNVIVIGIRAYSARPELTAAQPRLDEFVRRGGTLIVQYQTGNFPAPFPLSMGRMAERVVDETAPVKLLEPANPLLRWPNAIGDADFDGWVEERGHSFLDSWDAHYTVLTETADPGQDAQRGGLLVAHPGKGTYIYVAYALYRQLPELVPGAYRLLANLLSAGQDNAARGEQTPVPRP
jgi:LmbE family N-acetylglucosaminyl deacetylase